MDMPLSIRGGNAELAKISSVQSRSLRFMRPRGSGIFQ